MAFKDKVVLISSLAQYEIECPDNVRPWMNVLFSFCTVSFVLMQRNLINKVSLNFKITWNAEEDKEQQRVFVNLRSNKGWRHRVDFEKIIARKRRFSRSKRFKTRLSKRVAKLQLEVQRQRWVKTSRGDHTWGGISNRCFSATLFLQVEYLLWRWIFDLKLCK